ncbi:MAG: carboxypeptidase-like regulatory domain-containing protein [Planctomycetota bacterium]
MVRKLFPSLVFLVGAVGCGGGVQVAPVSGIVTLDGKPVADASVIFTPSSGGTPAVGRTDSAGEFRLKTSGRPQGVPIGLYRVAVIAKQTSGGVTPPGGDGEFGSLPVYGRSSKPPRTRWLTPPAYAKPESSGLQFEVKPGDGNRAELALTSSR